MITVGLILMACALVLVVVATPLAFIIDVSGLAALVTLSAALVLLIVGGGLGIVGQLQESSACEAGGHVYIDGKCIDGIEVVK